MDIETIKEMLSNATLADLLEEWETINQHQEVDPEYKQALAAVIAEKIK